MLSAISFYLDQSKILSSGNGLIHVFVTVTVELVFRIQIA